MLAAPLTCARRRSSGTVLYSHRGAALGEPLSFRDDLEALGYTLLHLAAGALPWEELVLTAVSEEARPSRGCVRPSLVACALTPAAGARRMSRSGCWT